MIGGADVTIPVVGAPAVFSTFARTIQQFWPDARWEDAITGDKYQKFELMAAGSVRELFVYRDAVVEAAADADEASSWENCIYLLFREDCVTVVVDDPDNTDMRSILASLKANLLDR